MLRKPSEVYWTDDEDELKSIKKIFKENKIEMEYVEQERMSFRNIPRLPFYHIMIDEKDMALGVKLIQKILTSKQRSKK